MAHMDPVAVAKKYVALLSAGNTADAARMHDAAMAAGLPEPKLRSTLASLVTKGPLTDCREFSNAAAGRFQVVVLNCASGPDRMLVKVSVDETGLVGGLYFAPAATTPEGAHKPAPYVDGARFSETPAVVKSGRFELAGTLAIPKGKGPFAAVVLVAGSGPHDQDETIGPNKPLKDLAQGLASRGVMALRYEKRTQKYGADISATKGTYTVQDEVVEDVLAAVQLLSARKDVSGVLVLGHSLGGYLVPRIGTQMPSLKGLVVMAGNVSPVEELVVAQVNHIQKHASSPEAGGATLEQLRTLAAAVKTLTPDSPPLMGAPASYWLDLRGYNPATMAAGLPQPMLLLQGGRDYQVPPSELELWKTAIKGRKDVTFKTYPDLNHLFMAGKGPSVPAEYVNPGNVDAAVVQDVAAFAKRVAVKP